MCPLVSLAQTQGNAFLQGETNHQGIRVIFTPVSVVGQADTAFTNAAGLYSANIQAGVYKIAFDKAGFNPRQYASGQAQALTGTDTLQDVTLSTLFYKYISGAVQDTFYEDTVYIAVNDIVVPHTTTLHLQPGTHLWFDGPHALTVFGGFEAVGTPAKPIYISADSTTGPPELWENILFNNPADTIRIEYCDISFGDEGMLFDISPMVILRNNRFHHSTHAVWMQSGSSSVMEENEFYSITDVCVTLAGTQGTSHDISCNYLHDSPASGIITYQSGSDLNILANTFVNLAGIYAGALDLVLESGDVLVQDNAILNTTVGIKLLVIDSINTTTTILNNLIYGNNTGILLRAADGGAVIQMNAIMDNVLYGVAQPYPPGGTPDVFTYNLVSGSPDNYYNLNVPGVGTIITTNANGTPADGYLNIDDPGMYDPMASVIPFMQTPLANAGDPNAPLDQDGTVTDIGVRSDFYCFTGFQGYNALVFPGDADYNQAANVWDLLSIGQHFGTTGPARPNASLAWQGQTMSDWGVLQSNGEDLKHVDTDGDGVIHASDTAAIMLNYNSTHNSISGKQNGGIPMYLGTPPQSMNPGDTIVMPLYLGTFDTLATDIYGMAFALTYDSSMVEPGSFRIDFDSSWVGTEGQDLLTLQKDLFVQEKIDVAFTRNDQMDQSGYGRIANVIVVLDEDIAKAAMPLHLNFVDMVAQDHSGQEISIGAQDAVMEVQTTDIAPDFDLVANVYPNPSRERLVVAFREAVIIEKIALWNLQGQSFTPAYTSTTNRVEMQMGELPAGIYLLRVETQEGRLHRRIQVVD